MPYELIGWAKFPTFSESQKCAVSLATITIITISLLIRIITTIMVIFIMICRDSDYAALQDFSQLMRDLRLGESKEHIYGE